MAAIMSADSLAPVNGLMKTIMDTIGWHSVKSGVPQVMSITIIQAVMNCV